MKSDNSITTLDRIKAESYCVIKTVSLRDDIKARFSEMGLVPETLVYVKNARRWETPWKSASEATRCA